MEILKNRIYELIKECQQIRDKEYNDKNYIEFDQDTKVYNNNISLICGLNEARHIIKASEGNTANSENTNCAIFDVSGSLPDKFADIIRFIESDLMEVKLYGNDGFDNQEELDGKDYLVKLIKEAVGNDR